MDDLDLAQMIFGNNFSPSKTPTQSNVNVTTTVQAEAISNSINGLVEVLIDNQPTQVATTFGVATGDICIVSITNNSPVVTGIVGKGDKTDQTIYGTLRASTVIAMELIGGKVNAEELEAVEAYIRDLTTENFNADNIHATTAELVKLIAKDAKFDNLAAVKATIDTLEATKAFIEALEAGEVTAQQLIATNAFITDLTASGITANKIKAAEIYVDALRGAYADVDELVSDLAYIRELDVDKLTAKLAIIDTLDTNYAKIDLTNINEGCIINAYIKDGTIETAKIKDGAINSAKIADATITAAKIHDIDADTITAGTLKTERLILVDDETGETSIIKAINAANGVAEPNGSKIQAQSIDVVDLYALNATIGGFAIDTTAIYGDKEHIDDPTPGVYIGLDGVGIGDGNVLGLEDKSPFMMKSDGTFWLGGESSNLIFDPITGDISINASTINIGATNVLEGLGSIDALTEQVNQNTTNIIQNAQGVRFEFNRVDGELDKNDEKWSELNSYIRFTEDGILINQNNDKSYSLLSDQGLDIYNNEEERSAYLNENIVHTRSGEFKDTVTIYDWIWKRQDNGNLSLLWRSIE